MLEFTYSIVEMDFISADKLEITSASKLAII
jgi:hypothetical protein